jgi:hemolysin III
MQNPVRGFLHGSAALAAAFGTIVLVSRAPSWSSRIAVTVFGLGMIALYTTSSLYHSIPWREVWKERMQRADHSMIFVLIAASYTPIAALALEGWLRWVTLVVVWGVTAVGVSHLAFFHNERYHLSIALMTTLGWLAVFIVWPVTQKAGVTALLFILAGGVVYTIGMVFLVTNRPRLWPRVFSYHEVFHILVITGTTLHFVATYRYFVPLAS